jgi:Carboxypeptidase regulatory-like domain
MNPRAKIMVALAVAAVAASSTFGSDNKILVIKGKVIDDEGKPADGTEVRVKSLDRKAPVKIVQTDSRGQYIVLGLAPGEYSITAYDTGGNARSRAMIKTDRKGWARVNFDLALDTIVGDSANRITGHDHMTSASSHLGPIPMLR